MPMPARTLKTFLRFMLEALHTRDQSPCDLPGHRSFFMNRNDRLISKRFEKTLVGRYLHESWALAREAPTHRLATRVFPNGTRLRAHDRGQGGWCGERHLSFAFGRRPLTRMLGLYQYGQRSGASVLDAALLR